MEKIKRGYILTKREILFSLRIALRKKIIDNDDYNMLMNIISEYDYFKLKKSKHDKKIRLFSLNEDNFLYEFEEIRHFAPILK
ncbi:MAG: hypothetical protein KatS3mg068_2671 [Candidatus Sericytochromatia bacterium]|nr:MAG: hypothetical protein KatS3mg068_2671 [Candidatus Sericytochromatia bacterium]